MLPSLVALSFVAWLAPGAPLHDTTVLSDGEVVAGSDATLYIRIDAALDPDRSEPLAGAEVRLSLARDKGDLPLASARTGADGVALVRFTAPAPGTHQLVIETRSAHGEDRVVRPLLSLERRLFVLRTDRTQYQPGQPIRWRSTLLNGVDGLPQRGAPLKLELEDARGTLLWRGEATSDAHGMASGEIPMSDAIRGGTLRLTALTGTSHATETLEVKRLAMPRFFVELVDLVGPDAQHQRSGRVVARYPYGEPVRGEARVLCGSTRVAAGPLVDGAFAFTAAVCRGHKASLKAEVSDGAGIEATRVTLWEPDVLMWAVPSRSRVEPGATVQVTALTTDTRGHYLPATITVTALAGSAPAVIESPGAVRFDAIADARGKLELKLAAKIGDRSAGASVQIYGPSGADAPLIDVPALSTGGGVLEVTGTWPRARGAVVVTMFRDNAPIATGLASIDADGRLRARLVPAAGVYGLVDLRAVEVAESGRSASTIAFLAPAALALSVDGETRHRPGERVVIPLRVSDQRGDPVGGAGLAVSVIDERALRLSKARADLLAEMRALEDANWPRRLFTADSTTTLAMVFARLSGSTIPEDGLAARALIEDLRARLRPKRSPAMSIDADLRRAAEERRLGELRPRLAEALDAATAPAFVKVDGAWAPRAPIEALWGELGKPPDEVATPWGIPTDWAYARRFDAELDRELGEDLVKRRLGALVAALQPLRKVLLGRSPPSVAALAADGRLEPRLASDPWGQPFVMSIEKVFDRPVGRWVRVVDVRSAGPDERLGTDDDPLAHDVFSALHVRAIGLGANGLGLSGGGVGGGGDGAARIAVIDDIPDKALRRRFDETVVWATGITTDRDGGAALTVPLADSVTGWRVQVEAVAPDGRVGALTTRLETFLPGHLEADAPARLVVGDRYGMRVIAADHRAPGAAPTRLTLVATADGGLATEAAATTLEVPPGEARARTIDLLAVGSGEGRVRVAWLDEAGAVVDAVEQRVVIEPIGAPVGVTVPGRIVDGRARFEVEIPSDIAARAEASVRVYRGLADVTFDALASILSEPHGCFEQTSSTTHPNLLVLELLGDRPEVAELRARARELVAKGYQRLASFEVEGGGFSLFGQAPASTVLTAYGLLELTDIGRVQAVDRPMLQRAARWLAAQQRADGTWPDDRAHHGEMGGGVATAFIAWAIAETLANDLDAPELDEALDRAFDHFASRGPDAAYGLALWAGAEALTRRPPVAGAALARFAQDDALGRSYPAGNHGTAMYASGELATVQSTALAAMALARGGAIVDAGRAVDWLLATRTRGGWGSSHGVMLALRAAAIVEGGRTSPGSGPLAVEVDGRRAGTLALTGAGVPNVTLEPLAPGPHVVTLAGEARGLRADLRLSWRTAAAPIAVADGLEVRVSGPDRAKVGEPLRQLVSLANMRDAAIAMPTVVIPIPAGWRADDDAVSRLGAVSGVAFAEDVGDALHVYFETLAARASVELPVALVADVPCAVTQRPVEAYAYYDPMIRGATPPARLVAD